MLKATLERLRQGYRTVSYPEHSVGVPRRFRGRPVVDETRCRGGCSDCADVCPTDAIEVRYETVQLDLGRCLFCTDCVEACSSGAIGYTQDYRLAVRQRRDLLLKGNELALATALNEKSRRLFGRSLKLRQVSAGGCNACETEINALTNIVFDIGRFGIQIVASPRHADGLLITGPVSKNMRLALQKTYEAVPRPKLVIALGACAISGGPFRGHPEVHDGADNIVPVDLYIPGCPPHPFTIIDGLLRLLGRIEEDAVRGRS